MRPVVKPFAAWPPRPADRKATPAVREVLRPSGVYTTPAAPAIAIVAPRIPPCPWRVEGSKASNPPTASVAKQGPIQLPVKLHAHQASQRFCFRHFVRRIDHSLPGETLPPAASPAPVEAPVAPSTAADRDEGDLEFTSLAVPSSAPSPHLDASLYTLRSYTVAAVRCIRHNKPTQVTVPRVEADHTCCCSP